MDKKNCKKYNIESEFKEKNVEIEESKSPNDSTNIEVMKENIDCNISCNKNEKTVSNKKNDSEISDKSKEEGAMEAEDCRQVESWRCFDNPISSDVDRPNQMTYPTPFLPSFTPASLFSSPFQPRFQNYNPQISPQNLQHKVDQQTQQQLFNKMMQHRDCYSQQLQDPTDSQLQFYWFQQYLQQHPPHMFDMLYNKSIQQNQQYFPQQDRQNPHSFDDQMDFTRQLQQHYQQYFNKVFSEHKQKQLQQQQNDHLLLTPLNITIPPHNTQTMEARTPNEGRGKHLSSSSVCTEENVANSSFSISYLLSPMSDKIKSEATNNVEKNDDARVKSDDEDGKCDDAGIGTDSSKKQNKKVTHNKTETNSLNVNEKNYEKNISNNIGLKNKKSNDKASDLNVVSKTLDLKTPFSCISIRGPSGQYELKADKANHSCHNNANTNANEKKVFASTYLPEVLQNTTNVSLSMTTSTTTSTTTTASIKDSNKSNPSNVKMSSKRTKNAKCLLSKTRAVSKHDSNSHECSSKDKHNTSTKKFSPRSKTSKHESLWDTLGTAAPNDAIHGSKSPPSTPQPPKSSENSVTPFLSSKDSNFTVSSDNKTSPQENSYESSYSEHNHHKHCSHVHKSQHNKLLPKQAQSKSFPNVSSSTIPVGVAKALQRKSSLREKEKINSPLTIPSRNFSKHPGEKDPNVENPICFNVPSITSRVITSSSARDPKTQQSFTSDSFNTNLLTTSNNKINSPQFKHTSNYVINDNNDAIDLTKTSLIAKNSLEQNQNNCINNIPDNNHQQENVPFDCVNIENCHRNNQLLKAEKNEMKDIEISKSFWVLPVDLSVNKASETEKSFVNKNTDLKFFDQSRFNTTSSTGFFQQSSSSLVKSFPKTTSPERNLTTKYENEISTQYNRFQLSSPRFATSSTSLNSSTSKKPDHFYTPANTQLSNTSLKSGFSSRSLYQNNNVNIFDYGREHGCNKERRMESNAYPPKFQTSHISNPSNDFSNSTTPYQNTNSRPMNRINSFSQINCNSLNPTKNVDIFVGQSMVDRASSPIHELSFSPHQSSSSSSKTSTETQTDLSTLSPVNNKYLDNTNGADNLFLLSSVAVESNNLPSTSFHNPFNFNKSSLPISTSAMSSTVKCSLLDIPVSMFLESFKSSSQSDVQETQPQISTHSTSNQFSSASFSNYPKSVDSISSKNSFTFVKNTTRNSASLSKSISFDSDFNSIHGSESEDIEANSSEINLRKKMKKVQEMYKKEKEEFDKLQKFLKNKNKPSKRKAKEISSPSSKNITCNKISIKSNNNQKTKKIIAGKTPKKSDKEINEKTQFEHLNYQSSLKENFEKDSEKIDKTCIIERGTSENKSLSENNTRDISDSISTLSEHKVHENVNGSEKTSLIDITGTSLCNLEETLHLIKKEKTSNKNHKIYSNCDNINLQPQNKSFHSLQNNFFNKKNNIGDTNNYSQLQTAYELSNKDHSQLNSSKTSHQNHNAPNVNDDENNGAINLKTSINYKTEYLNDNSFTTQHYVPYATTSYELQKKPDNLPSTNQLNVCSQQISNGQVSNEPHHLQSNVEQDVKCVDKLQPLNITENNNKNPYEAHIGSNDESNTVQNLSLKPQKARDPVSISREELKDGMKVLYLKDQLLVEATIKNISPPEIYGVTLLKDRARKPEILPLEELLSRVVKIVQPTSLEQLTPKTRVCAHWSVKFSCFYPGTIEEDDSDDGDDEEEDEDDNDKKEKNLKEEKEKKTRGRKPKMNKDKNILQNAKKSHSTDDNNSEMTNKTDVENASVGSSGSKKNKIVKKELKDLYVNIDFDDEDSGKFPIDFIRLLPKDFPIQKVEDKKDVITRKKKLSKYKNKSETKMENININTKNNKKDLVSIKSEFGEIIPDKSDKKEFNKNKHKNKLANSNNISMNRFWRKRKVLSQNTLEKKKIKTFKQSDCKGFSKHEKHFKVNLNRSIDQGKGGLVDDNSIDHNKFQANSPITLSKSKQNTTSIASSSETLSNLSVSSAEKKLQSGTEECKARNTAHSTEMHTTKDKSLVAKGRKQSPSPSNIKSLTKISAGTSCEWNWQGPSIKRQVSRSKTKKAFFNAIRRGSELIELGDSVVFVSNGKSMLKFVGRVQSLWQTGERVMKVRVRWYYHPEETRGGNQILETKRALFQSCHEDDNDVQTISHKCKVLSYQEFKVLLDQQTSTNNSPTNQQSFQGNFGQQSQKDATNNHGFKQTNEGNVDKKEDELKGNSNTNNSLNDVYYLAGTYEPTKNIIHFEPGVPLLKNNIGNYN